MNHLQTFQVIPALPEPVAFLETLSRNLWWCWHFSAIGLLRRIDPRIWNETGRNPLAFFIRIHPDRWKELSRDESFLAHLNRVKDTFEKEIQGAGAGTFFQGREALVYFSMEFGIHESLPLFAGGLGVLAGDHLKAASDMHLPMIGIGLLYHKGYFHQFLDQNGWQQEENPESDFFHLPIERAKDPDNNEVRVAVPGPDGDIHAAVWKVAVGNVALYLLDSNIGENPPNIRSITSMLYHGDAKIRLAQEILLGFGGIRILEALKIFPAICHLNEGHAAFSSIGRLEQIRSTFKTDLNTALEIGPRTTIFTTHTPVAAGHDEFPKEMVRPYFEPLAERLGIGPEEILAWGQIRPEDPVSMFVLGLRMSMYRNGVSELHGQTARRMWAHVWPGWPVEEVPITHITNGVHIPSWISVENALLFERYVGPDWFLKSGNSESLNRISQIYSEEIWRAHETSRSRLIRNCREIATRQYSRRNAPRTIMLEAESVLDADILTLSFARRFTAYKRAGLLLSDPDRLEAMMNHPTHPVQFIFAGKAHPKDDEGKKLIQKLFQFAQRESVQHRILFLEDYDTHMARLMVQGSDVWLNTPRRPLEASGTSGMKAAANGVLNVSILDGWWHEGYAEGRGWAFGGYEDYPDHAYQDSIESQALYNVLENEVIPCFYDRKNGGAPEKWIQKMRQSMKMAISQFSTKRMVQEYQNRFYDPALENYRVFTADAGRRAQEMVHQRHRLKALWEPIRVSAPVREKDGPFRVGERFQVTADVFLGELKPEEVCVELYSGSLKNVDTVAVSWTAPMAMLQDLSEGNYRYGCAYGCGEAGRFGFTVRVTPEGDAHLKYMPGFISWA